MARLEIVDRFGKKTEIVADLPEPPDLKSLCGALQTLQSKSNELLTVLVTQEKQGDNLPDVEDLDTSDSGIAVKKLKSVNVAPTNV